MDGLRDRQGDKLMVILFWANWYPECEDLRMTLDKIAENLQHIIICWVSCSYIPFLDVTSILIDCVLLRLMCLRRKKLLITMKLQSSPISS